ncbi:hypothetical protein BURK2_01407 [Burkholderiales bacterium]|nr:hypothetical protein BURK2_01407 [Burkholderiales bacterium]
MTLVSFIIGLVGPVLARILAQLGLGLVVMTGLYTAYATLKGQVIAGIGAQHLWAVQLGGLMGIWEALGIVMGAFVFVITWRGANSIWSVVKTAA